MATRKKRFWYIDNSTLRPRMGIVEKATNTTTKDGWTSDFVSISEAKDITIYAIARDNDLVNNALTATWTQIPEQYHDAMVAKVIAEGYKKPPKLAMYFEGEYVTKLKAAKKFSKANYTTVGTIAPSDF
mgnify:CR=1 FL=1